MILGYNFVLTLVIQKPNFGEKNQTFSSSNFKMDPIFIVLHRIPRKTLLLQKNLQVTKGFLFYEEKRFILNPCMSRDNCDIDKKLKTKYLGNLNSCEF